MTFPVPRRGDVSIVEVVGNPTPEEREVLQRALEGLVEHERRGGAASIWRRAGRARGHRLGMFDYRDRFSRDDAWRLSLRFPFGGREYVGLHGRGDAK